MTEGEETHGVPDSELLNPELFQALVALSEVGVAVQHQALQIASELGQSCPAPPPVLQVDLMSGELSKTAESAIQVGDSVVLAENYAKFSDAKDGPLSLGDIGEVIKVDTSSMPLQVKFRSREWWYARDALRRVDGSKVTKKAKSKASRARKEAEKQLKKLQGELESQGLSSDDDSDGKIDSGSDDDGDAEEGGGSRGDATLAAPAIRVGDYVLLATDDATDGPLSFGDTGKAIAVDGRDDTVQVEFESHQWWYARADLQRAQSQRKVLADFTSESDYATYLKSVLKPEKTLLIAVAGERKDQCGTYLGTNSGQPPCHVRWTQGGGHWVHWRDVEIDPQDPDFVQTKTTTPQVTRSRKSTGWSQEAESTEDWSQKDWSQEGWSQEGWTWSQEGWSQKGWSQEVESSESWSQKGWSQEAWSAQEGWSQEGWQPSAKPNREVRVEACTWMSHHGSKALISADRYEALRLDGYNASIVVADAPKQEFHLQVVEVESGWFGSLQIGFLSAGSECLECVNQDDIEPSTSVTDRQLLSDVKVGDIVSGILQEGGLFCVLVNNKCKFTSQSGLTDGPVCAVASIYGKVKKVKLVPRSAALPRMFISAGSHASSLGDRVSLDTRCSIRAANHNDGGVMFDIGVKGESPPASVVAFTFGVWESCSWEVWASSQPYRDVHSRKISAWTKLASGSSSSRNIVTAEFSEAVRIEPGTKCGFYIYGDNSSAIEFKDNPAGFTAEDNVLEVHRGTAMFSRRWQSSNRHGSFEMCGSIHYQLAVPMPSTSTTTLSRIQAQVAEQQANVEASRMVSANRDLQEIRKDPDTDQLSELFGWSQAQKETYMLLKADLKRTVGLQPVKDFIMRHLWDAGGKNLFNEPKQLHRHIVISGRLGVGKWTAAALIGRIYGLLGGRAPQDNSAYKGLKGRGEKLLGLSRASTDQLHYLNSLDDLVDSKTKEIKVSPNSCYFVRVTEQLQDKDGVILEAVQHAKSIVILCCDENVAAEAFNLPVFIRKQQESISLPALGAGEVARLVAAKLEAQGYKGVGDSGVGTSQLITVLELIIRNRFDDTLIQTKNAYLANDVLDLAVSRKNDRVRKEPVDSDSRRTLTPSDFGLDVLTLEQRQLSLQEVQQEAQNLIGWNSPSLANSPVSFFSLLEQGLQSGTSDLPRALWVVANPGTGRRRFARLAARCLRATGTIPREDITWVEAGDLASASDPREFLATHAAKAGQGCIAILNADKLVDLPQALKALAYLGTKGLSMVIGEPTAMQRASRVEPALIQRFPTRVTLPDLDARELATLVELSAHELPAGSLVLEDGLLEKLTKHITEVYGCGQESGPELGEKGNMGLVRQLLQQACQKRMARVFASMDPTMQGGEHISNVLIASDFEIGSKLGETAEEKAAINDEIAQIIGMDKAKNWFEQMRQKVCFVEQTGTRSDLRVCMNLIITGNPGTGKTTFARLLARFFYTYGILQKDSFVEKNGLELKAEHMGGTAPKVKAAVKEALGGCLFLDEAYALIDSSAGVGGSGDAFSQEALRTLLTEVENNRTNLMVVLAGYKEKMGKLMRAEEGLARRFPNRLHLDDYTPAELAQICEMTARTRHQRIFAPGLLDQLTSHIQNFYWRDISKQNAGLAVNLTEQALDKQIIRLVHKHQMAFQITPRHASTVPDVQPPVLRRMRSATTVVRDDVSTFMAADFGIEERPQLGDPELRKRVQQQVEQLTGMGNVKAFFNELSKTVAFVERGGDPVVLQTCLNLRLTGNPGTGKTTVARLIGRYLYAYGILPRDVFIEKNALALKGQFVGQSAPTVMEAVHDAMGGCLFIDEAYALVDRGGDKFSGEVVRTLLTEVENHRTGLLVVLAGYADKMEALMDSDPGLRRRFALSLFLEDYSPEELAQICKHAAKDRFRLGFADGLEDSLAYHIGAVHGADIPQHNGGLAISLVEQAFRKMATRLGDPASNIMISSETKQVLLPEDFGICSSRSASSNVKSSISPPSRIHRPTAVAAQTSVRDLGAVGVLAKDLAKMLKMTAEAIASLADVENVPAEAEDGPVVLGPAKAQMLAVAKSMAKEKERPVGKSEEPIALRPGESVVEDVNVQDVLNEMGVCPMNFEWVELGAQAEGTCDHCQLCVTSGDFRCAGGSHFVCMSCIVNHSNEKGD